jgi:hypothetical protein
MGFLINQANEKKQKGKIIMFVNDLRLEIIATYETNEQEFFTCGVWESAIKSEKKLINYIKKHLLKDKDLIKLSLCWICSKNVVDKYKTIQKSISKNGKYFFN